MIRPTTLISMLLAAGSGLYLYQVKHQAQLLDEQIAHILTDTDHARQRTGALITEYALLNDPSRLQDLAAAHLKLRPTEPTQFTTLAELVHRLPPVGPSPATATEPPADIAPSAVTPVAPPSVAATAEARPRAAMTTVQAGAAAVPPANPAIVAVRPPRTRPSLAAQGMPSQSLFPQSTPALFGAPVQSAMLPPQRPATRAPMTALLAAAHAVRPAPPALQPEAPPAPPTAPVMGSALGMARTLGSSSTGYVGR